MARNYDGLVRTERDRLTSVLVFHKAAGKLSDEQYRLLMKRLSYGMYRYVNEMLDEILDD